MELTRSHRVAGHDGVEICVHEYAGAGPPLVLCHCTGTLGRIWEPVIRALGGAYQTFAVDARGHGDSEQPQVREAYAWECSGRDLLAVIDALGLGAGVWAVGHSAGAAHIAYAEMLRPGTVSKSILIEAIVGPRIAFQGENPLAVSARRRRNVFESVHAARERLGGKPPMSAWTLETLDVYIEHGLRALPDGQVALRCPGAIEAWMYEQGGACDVYERLEELKFNALVLAGGDSNVRALAELQSERLPHSRLVVWDGVSHFVPQERPAEVAALIRDWFSDNGDAPGLR